MKNTINSNFHRKPITGNRLPITDKRSPDTNHRSLITVFLKKFTLIEILVTIVIMALLMTIAMPAFTEMMKGQGVEASARNLGQMLKLARSHAINNREYVALLIPKTGLPENYNYRSYRVCLVNSDKSFKRWLSGEDWHFLSTGVAVVDIEDNPARNASDYDQAETISGVNCTSIDAAYSNVSLPGIIFKPSGKITKTSPVYIITGQATNSGGNLVSTGTADGDVIISINPFTGRVNFED